MQVLETKNFKEATIFTDKGTKVANLAMSSTRQLRWKISSFLCRVKLMEIFKSLHPQELNMIEI